jgi:hypothetical protein
MQRSCLLTYIPEPTSTLGLLALGAFGGGSYFKRWRKQKVEA